MKFGRKYCFQRSFASLVTLIVASIFFGSCGFTSRVSPLEETNLGTFRLDEASLQRFILDPEKIPQDPLNPLTPAKVKLGQALFFDTATAANPTDGQLRHTYSCAACHTPAAGFSVRAAQAVAEGGQGFGEAGESRRPSPNAAFWDLQPVRSLSILNVAYQRNTLSSGVFGAKSANEKLLGDLMNSGSPIAAPFAFNILGFDGVETQAIAAQFTHGLMHASPDQEITSVNVHAITQAPSRNFEHAQEYRTLYEDAFPELRGRNDLISAWTSGLAIAAYERTVLATDAPFQRYLRGESNALTEGARRGMEIFFDPRRGNCVSCHSGTAFGADEFYALGFKDFDPRRGLILPGPKDESGQTVFITSTTMDSVPESAVQSALRSAALGRGLVPQQERHARHFRVPQLYNLIDSGFYGHGGSFRSIEKLIRYKINRQSENPDISESELSPQFQSAVKALSEEDIADLTEFVSSGLRDPNLVRYAPLRHDPQGNRQVMDVPSKRSPIVSDPD